MLAAPSEGDRRASSMRRCRSTFGRTREVAYEVRDHPGFTELETAPTLQPRRSAARFPHLAVGQEQYVALSVRRVFQLPLPDRRNSNPMPSGSSRSILERECLEVVQAGARGQFQIYLPQWDRGPRISARFRRGDGDRIFMLEPKARTRWQYQMCSRNKTLPSNGAVGPAIMPEAMREALDICAHSPRCHCGEYDAGGIGPPVRC